MMGYYIKKNKLLVKYILVIAYIKLGGVDMSSYREIVTKAVIGKGKKLFTTENTVKVDHAPSTILGCWVINHNFHGDKQGEQITISGSYDVNIWYSYDRDTKTDVVKETNHYQEVVRMRSRDDDTDNEDIIVRSLKQPTCANVRIEGNEIHYTIEKELGIELVGDVKVKIEADDEEDPWDEIVDESSQGNTTSDVIDEELQDDFIEENTI